MFIRGLPIGGGTSIGPVTGVTIAGTPGSIAFFGSDGLIAEDNANLFFDDTNNRQGIGTNAPIANLDIRQAATAGGTPIILNVVGAALTGQAAGVEKQDVVFDLSHTVTFATGALATQRAFTISAPTYAFAGASTLTQASTFYISGAPITGANATITHPLAMRIDVTGNAGAFFAGDISLSTYSTEPTTFEIASPATTSRRRTLRIAGGAITNMAGGELIDVNIIPSNVEFSSGTTLALQRGIYISSPTWSATSAKTISQANTVYIEGPTRGSNITWGAIDVSVNNAALFALFAGGAGGLHASINGVDGFVPGPALDLCYGALSAINLPAGTEYGAFLTGAPSGDTIRWAGAPAVTQRWYRFHAPTLGRSGGSSTITNAATVYIDNAPIAGTGITITSRWALWVAAGSCRFDGNMYFTGTNVGLRAATAATSIGVYASSNTTRAFAIYEGTGTDTFLACDNVNDRIMIGYYPNASIDALMTNPVNILVNANALNAVQVHNESASGNSSLLFTSRAGGAARMVIGYGNGAAINVIDLLSSTNFAFAVNGTNVGGILYAGLNFSWGLAPASMNTVHHFDITQPVTSGAASPRALNVTGGAHTTMTNAEASDVVFGLNRTAQFGQNTTLTTQRAIQILAPTYSSSVATKTITDAVTLDINAAPTVGTNVAITNPYALRVQAGETRLLGGLRVTGNIGFFGGAAVAQQTVGAVTNSVTAGGVDGTIANFTDLTVYANDSATIRDDLYQLARTANQLATAIRNLSLGA